MKPFVAIVLAFPAAALVAAACNNPPLTSAYDHKCASVADCAAVGDACESACGCPSDAIAKTALQQFESDHATCKPTAACDCVNATVLCTAGKCGLEGVSGGTTGW
jgi:hypothetical protein